jgi:hypothetical protein
MKKKPNPTHDRLPDALAYLQPVANALAKLPPETLNEDIDATKLRKAVRKRVQELDIDEAEVELAKDAKTLEQWLMDKPEHPAHWIYGLISSHHLVFDLFGIEEALPPLPNIEFEPPKGWRVKITPRYLQLKRRRLTTALEVTDDGMFEVHEQNWKNWKPNEGLVADRRKEPVQCGVVSGTKYTYLQSAPCFWMAIDYSLAVPGGTIRVTMFTSDGSAFDEKPLEAQFHTLKIASNDVHPRD